MKADASVICDDVVLIMIPNGFCCTVHNSVLPDKSLVLLNALSILCY
jgi:hypothetical protein